MIRTAISPRLATNSLSNTRTYPATAAHPGRRHSLYLGKPSSTGYLLAHDLLGKPVTAFPDQALVSRCQAVLARVRPADQNAALAINHDRLATTQRFLDKGDRVAAPLKLGRGCGINGRLELQHAAISEA